MDGRPTEAQLRWAKIQHPRRAMAVRAAVNSLYQDMDLSESEQQFQERKQRIGQYGYHHPLSRRKTLEVETAIVEQRASLSHVVALTPTRQSLGPNRKRSAVRNPRLCCPPLLDKTASWMTHLPKYEATSSPSKQQHSTSLSIDARSFDWNTTNPMSRSFGDCIMISSPVQQRIVKTVTYDSDEEIPQPLLAGYKQPPYGTDLLLVEIEDDETTDDSFVHGDHESDDSSLLVPNENSNSMVLNSFPKHGGNQQRLSIGGSNAVAGDIPPIPFDESPGRPIRASPKTDPCSLSLIDGHEVGRVETKVARLEADFSTNKTNEDEKDFVIQKRNRVEESVQDTGDSAWAHASGNPLNVSRVLFDQPVHSCQKPCNLSRSQDSASEVSVAVAETSEEASNNVARGNRDALEELFSAFDSVNDAQKELEEEEDECERNFIRAIAELGICSLNAGSVSDRLNSSACSNSQEEAAHLMLSNPYVEDGNHKPPAKELLSPNFAGIVSGLVEEIVTEPVQAKGNPGTNSAENSIAISVDNGDDARLLVPSLQESGVNSADDISSVESVDATPFRKPNPSCQDLNKRPTPSLNVSFTSNGSIILASPPRVASSEIKLENSPKPSIDCLSPIQAGAQTIEDDFSTDTPHVDPSSFDAEDIPLQEVVLPHVDSSGTTKIHPRRKNGISPNSACKMIRDLSSIVDGSVLTERNCNMQSKSTIEKKFIPPTWKDGFEFDLHAQWERRLMK